ncbi:tetratricopeptide repeat protein [Magnetospira sp. QH-2]|uniref:tetratricopeptide repeat protein n=1 Tax=Magnetospira sp. (strain QH-2) TaxID=1288970 RepID=UPI0003E80E3F|nr:SEL1-like repeat protein [Magnetospira sp. QH-2]CCQ74442.1 protein of unknown function [Magnetospira sp. QH-2]
MTDSTQLFFSQPLRDLQTGNGVYPAPDRAVSWLRLAARKGHPEALYNLAKRYLTGDGLSKNENSHGVYLLMAAERNHANAQRELGILYLQSSEDTILVYKALVWLLRARKNGLDVTNEIQAAEQLLDSRRRQWAYEEAFDFEFVP